MPSNPFTKEKPEGVGYYWVKTNGGIIGPKRLYIEDFRPNGIVHSGVEFSPATPEEIAQRPDRKLFSS